LDRIDQARDLLVQTHERARGRFVIAAVRIRITAIPTEPFGEFSRLDRNSWTSSLRSSGAADEDMAGRDRKGLKPTFSFEAWQRGIRNHERRLRIASITQGWPILAQPESEAIRVLGTCGLGDRVLNQ
jgi:hypothetical protein